MSTQHLHPHRPEKLLSEIEKLCAHRKIRFTPLRSAVLNLVVQHKHPIKAYELLDLLKQDYANAAPITVYRVLDFLVTQGFIHKLESINAYTVCHHPETHHAVPFLICDTCHIVVEMCHDKISPLITTEAQKLGFMPEPQTLEIHGICDNCQKITASP